MKLRKQIFGRENAVLTGMRTVRYRARGGDASYLPLLSALLQAEDYQIHEAVIMQFIARVQSDEALPLLFEALTSQNRDVRRWGVWGLGALKAQDAIPALAPFLERGFTRVWTAAALVEIGDARGLELLEAAANRQSGPDRDWLLKQAGRLRTKLDQTLD
jgi:HEAT repeat protein